MGSKHVSEPVSGLQGREEALATVRSAIAVGRVVTLVGAGGMGKSCVARAVVAALPPPWRAVRCPLEDVRDAEGLVSAVASALASSSSSDADPVAGTRELEERASVVRDRDGLLTLLRDRSGSVRSGSVPSGSAPSGSVPSGSAPWLLWLDDADGVLGELAALLADAARRAPGVAWLITSREAVAVAAEQVVELGPLDRESALALFEAAADGGAWTRDELDTLLDRLDGLPLAIELAARRSRLVPPGALLARLDDRLALLRSNRRDVAARHATLTGTIEWSLGRLEDDERRAFAGLGLFAGPVTLDAYEAVVGPLLGDRDPVDLLEALLRKSLVLSGEAPGAARVRTLRPIHAFARDEARGLSGLEGARQRHARYFVERAEAEAARAYGRNARDALDALADLQGNLLLAFAEVRKADPGLAARAVIALGDLVVLRHTLDLRGGPFAAAREAADDADVPALRVNARVLEARVILEIGKPVDAEAALVDALRIAEDAVPELAADVRRSLAWAQLALGRPADALATTTRALEAHKTARHLRGEADALAARALARCFLGEIGEGHADLEHAHALHRFAGDGIRAGKVEEMARLVGLELAPVVPDDEAALASRRAELLAVADEHRAGGRLWREAVARVQLAALAPSAEARGRELALARGAAIEAGISVALASSVARGSGVTDTAPDADASAPAAAAKAGASGERAAVPSGWAIGPDALWLEAASGARTDLARHGPLRRVLDSLVTRRLESPGAPATALDLLEAGWPGERVRHESGMLRVYTIVRRLRALGLGDALVTREGGYLLDPDTPIARRER